MLVQAFECVEDENYSEALKLYDLALKEEPDNASVLIDKGATLQNMGKLKLAIRSYDRALEISPENTWMSRFRRQIDEKKVISILDCLIKDIIKFFG